jgi:transcriptional regulator with XRE-family HTH domain/N-acetylneuraminic acid mutarotase
MSCAREPPPKKCSQAHLQRTCKELQEQFLGVALDSHIWLRLLANACDDTQARTFLKGRAMVFITQESAGRSGESSRLRDKLLLFNARTRLSQQGVASFVGVSTAALRNWEAGQSKPTAQNLKRLIELYVAYRAFAEGEEQAEAADLWEAAQERGLKVPFDEQWFQELLANQKSLHPESERERVPEQKQEPNKANEQESGAQVSDDRSSIENESALPSQPSEAILASTTYKLSRRTVAVGLTCLVVGGAVGSSLTWIALRPQTSLLSQAKWTQVGNMQHPRGFFRATLLPKGQVSIEGGMLPDKSITAVSEIFDPTSRSWRKTQGSLNEARAKHTATLLPDGMVLVTGGFGTGTLSSAELYVPASGTWQLTSKTMSHPRARHTATLLQTGEVLIAGGAPDYFAELYDYKTDTWSLTQKMVSLRYDHIAVSLLDGKVLVAGGRTKNDNKNINKDNYSITNSAELFDPNKNTWTKLPDMKLARADFTAALLPGGRVLVIGGILPKGDVTQTTEIYDPITRSWQSGASMNNPRLNPLGQEALQFDDDTIMVMGGDTQGTSERYIPTTNKWVSVLRLHSLHYIGATVTLGNGQALVAGGFDVLSLDDKSKINARTEIYLPGTE